MGNAAQLQKYGRLSTRGSEFAETFSVPARIYLTRVRGS